MNQNIKCIYYSDIGIWLLGEWSGVWPRFPQGCGGGGQGIYAGGGGGQGASGGCGSVTTLNLHLDWTFD